MSLHTRVLRTDGLISGSNGLDWYEGAIAKPADVLQDLSSALAAPSDKVQRWTVVFPSHLGLVAQSCI